MSDRFSATIRIGGRLKRASLADFLVSVRASGVQLDWGEASFDPGNEKELLQAVDCNHLVFCDEEARYGEFDQLEVDCRRIGLSYQRHSGAYLDYDAELVDWRPGMVNPLCQHVTESGQVLVPQVKVKRALRALSRDAMDRAVRILRSLCPDIPPLPPFRTV